MTNLDLLVARLREHGMLLLQDKRLPDVATAVAGEPIRGSWWAHPCAHAIFACLSELEQHPDTLATKLVAGKVTFIHRRLWPAVLAVGMSREPWQFAGITADARDLYAAIEEHGMIMAAGRTAKELERRLLVHSTQVHTDAGHHELRLERWELWADRVGAGSTLTARSAQLQVQAAVLAIGGTASALPWAA